MNKKWNPWCVSRKRNGLTLIEVVAGLALMATVLVGILEAGGRHVQQIKRARRQLAAAVDADRLLAGMAGNFAQLPDNNSGSECNDGLMWRTRPIENREARETMNIAIVRLEIFDPKQTKDQTPLVAIDVVKPLPPREDEKHTQDKNGP